MDNELLKARIFDTADICLKTARPKYLGFLTAEEAVLAERLLKNHPVSHSFFGGYEGAERLVLGCFPDWMEEKEYPISAISFSYRNEDKLTHRDFLGSLMALGIKRETVGDILTEEKRAVVFVLSEVSDYIKAQVTKIGRTGVTLTDGFTEPLPESDKMTECTDTAASERLDCIIAAICSISRSAANEAILEQRVSVNSVVAVKATKAIQNGDVITVRGKGRFVVVSLDCRTKKNRIIIKYRKYK